MNKGTHFIGQPVYGQPINLLDKSKIIKFSREKGGERYVKHFDAWQHLVVMLYAVIKRYDSLCEIAGCMLPEVLLLRRERQCHQDTDLGHTHRQPAAYGHTETHQTLLELLGNGHHVPHHAHVLRQLLHFF